MTTDRWGATASRIELSALFLVIVATGGCATYSEKLETARLYTDQGAYREGVGEINAILDVESSEEIPDTWKGDQPVAVLERAVLLQALGEYKLSARDLGSAETELELLDIEAESLDVIGKYVYSDSAQDYEASPTERVALNGVNMLNYLALADLSGAAVEARRFTSMRDYLSSIDLESTGTFGAYLAGFAFEHLGEGDRALRYYEEALEGGALESLVAPVRRLARSNPYRGPRLEALLASAGGEAAASERPQSEILTVFALGRVPSKVPKRIPIGAAVGIAGTLITGNTAILERSIFKVVVYPDLEKSSAMARDGKVDIDGNPGRVESVSDLGADIAREYEQIKGKIIAAALTRMIARALAAEGARIAGRQVGGVGGLIGLLAALVTEGSLVALDKPDTRSWTFLPDRIAIARTPVEPGKHLVEVRVGGVGESRRVPVDVPAGGFAVVVVTVPR